MRGAHLLTLQISASRHANLQVMLLTACMLCTTALLLLMTSDPGLADYLLALSASSQPFLLRSQSPMAGERADAWCCCLQAAGRPSNPHSSHPLGLCILGFQARNLQVLADVVLSPLLGLDGHIGAINGALHAVEPRLQAPYLVVKASPAGKGQASFYKYLTDYAGRDGSAGDLCSVHAMLQAMTDYVVCLCQDAWRQQKWLWTVARSSNDQLFTPAHFAECEVMGGRKSKPSAAYTVVRAVQADRFHSELDEEQCCNMAGGHQGVLASRLKALKACSQTHSWPSC